MQTDRSREKIGAFSKGRRLLLGAGLSVFATTVVPVPGVLAHDNIYRPKYPRDAVITEERDSQLGLQKVIFNQIAGIGAIQTAFNQKLYEEVMQQPADTQGFGFISDEFFYSRIGLGFKTRIGYSASINGFFVEMDLETETEQLGFARSRLLGLTQITPVNAISLNWYLPYITDSNLFVGDRRTIGYSMDIKNNTPYPQFP